MEASNRSEKVIECDEQKLLIELRCLIEEFLTSGKGSPKVQKWLSSIKADDVLLLIYLKGRKYRVQHAWETLQRNAEVRFNEYPEHFLDENEIKNQLTQSERNGTINGIGVLKCRSKDGARIFVWNTGKTRVCFHSMDYFSKIKRMKFGLKEEWDLKKTNVEQMFTVGTYYIDRMIFDEDVINNGAIFIKNCAGLGIRHGMQYTLPTMLKILNIFWYSYPVKIDAIYIVNLPYYLQYLYQLIRPFFSKKLKEKIILTTKDKQFKAVHEKIPSTNLPKVLGGVLDNETAFDSSFHDIKLPYIDL